MNGLNSIEHFEQSQNETEAALLDYKIGLGTFTQKMSDLAHHFNAFTEACFKYGKL